MSDSIEAYVDPQPAELLFRHKVLSLLRKAGVIDEDRIALAAFVETQWVFSSQLSDRGAGGCPRGRATRTVLDAAPGESGAGGLRSREWKREPSTESRHGRRRVRENVHDRDRRRRYVASDCRVK